MSLTEAAASAAARAFFYPSLLWNIARSRLQSDWQWYTAITEHVILGAIPFQSMLEEFKEKGVKAVVTLNEGFELFVSSSQYKECGFSHLHLPTVDFLYAPALDELYKGTEFIAEHAGRGDLTYVHCKAGRGRSTTLVLCYLIRYLAMTPEEAFEFVRAKRPQVCLAQGQWNSVVEFYQSCRLGEEPQRLGTSTQPADVPVLVVDGIVLSTDGAAETGASPEVADSEEQQSTGKALNLNWSDTVGTLDSQGSWQLQMLPDQVGVGSHDETSPLAQLPKKQSLVVEELNTTNTLRIEPEGTSLS